MENICKSEIRKLNPNEKWFLINELIGALLNIDNASFDDLEKVVCNTLNLDKPAFLYIINFILTKHQFWKFDNYKTEVLMKLRKRMLDSADPKKNIYIDDYYFVDLIESYHNNELWLLSPHFRDVFYEIMRELKLEFNDKLSEF